MSIEDRIKELFEEEKPYWIRITREAFQKMNTYARLASEIVGEDIECGGPLLNYRNKQDNITRDVYLMDNQEVTPSEGRLKLGDSYAAARDEGKKVCGIWHSHGAWKAFHSEFDDSQLRILYASNRENKIQLGKRRCNTQTNYENGTLTIKAGDKLITIKTKEKPEDITTEQLIERKFINSIVINRESYLNGIKQPYQGYYGECLLETKKGEAKKLKKLELELVEENNTITKDERELLKECGEKVIYKGIRLKEYPNYKNLLKEYGTLETKIANAKTKNSYRQNLRQFYQNHQNIDEIDEAAINIAKILAGDFKKNNKRVWKWNDRMNELEEQYKLIKELLPEKKEPRPLKTKKNYQRRIRYAMKTASTYTELGLLAISIVALKGIERASLYQLRKTRPDVASMIEKGGKLSEIARVYFSKNGRK